MRILVKSEEVKSKNPERFRIQDFMVHLQGFEPRDLSHTHMIKSQLLYTLKFKNKKSHSSNGAPSGIRTRDPLIKSQLLYQLS